MDTFFSTTRILLYFKIFCQQFIPFSVLYLIILFFLKYRERKDASINDSKMLYGFKDLYLIFLFTTISFYILLFFAPLAKSIFIIEHFEGVGSVLLLMFILFNRKIDRTVIKSVILGKPIKKKGLFLGISVGLAYTSLYILIAAIFSKELSSRSNLLSTNSFLGFLTAFLLSCIITPFAEELYSKGLFYNLIRKKIGIKFGIIITAVLFAVAHAMNINIIIIIVIQGIISSYLFEKSETILIPMLFHSYNNLVLLIMSANNNYISSHITITHFLYFAVTTIGVIYTIYIAYFSKVEE